VIAASSNSIATRLSSIRISWHLATRHSCLWMYFQRS